MSSVYKMRDTPCTPSPNARRPRVIPVGTLTTVTQPQAEARHGDRASDHATASATGSGTGPGSHGATVTLPLLGPVPLAVRQCLPVSQCQ